MSRKPTNRAPRMKINSPSPSIIYPTKINAMREAGFYAYELAEILDVSLSAIRDWRRPITPKRLIDRHGINKLYDIYVSKNVTNLNFIGRAEIALEFLGLMPKAE